VNKLLPAIVSLALALAVITVVGAQGQIRAHHHTDVGATATPALQATCTTAGTGNHSGCSPAATPFPITVATSSTVGSTAPVPGPAVGSTHSSSQHGKGHGPGLHGKAGTHGHGHITVHGNARKQDNEGDDANQSGHPNNHGAAVSRAARSGCTAMNPHNPKVRNHGMCVSVIARGNH
jgi:hypothetical protein